MEKFLISIITIATIYIYMFWLMLMNAASYFILSGFGIDNKATMDRNMEEMRKSDGCLNPEIYPYQNQKDFTKGGVRKIKMEI